MHVGRLRAVAGSGKAIVIVGGYRTGSTLQYNLVGIYLETSAQGRRIGLVDPDDVGQVLPAQMDQEPGIVVAKCHHLAEGFGNFRDPTAWRQFVASGVAIPLSTTRPRHDVERSISRKFGIPMEELHDSTTWRVDQANRSAWAEFAPFEQTYQELTEAPGAALRAVADHLHLRWDADAAVRAVADSGLDVARSVTRTLQDGTWDPVSLLHWNHIAPAHAESAPVDTDASAGARTDDGIRMPDGTGG